MSRLLSLKPWLSLSETAAYLQTIFNEQVTTADIFRFCLNGHLTLTANFVNHGRAKLARKVRIRDAGFTIMPSLIKGDQPSLTLSCSAEALPEFDAWLDAHPDEAALIANRAESLFICMQGDEVSPTECITRGDHVEVISGLWDLTMIGAERLDVENYLQQSIGGPEVELICLDGVLLSRPDGTYARLQAEFTDSERPNKSVGPGATAEERQREQDRRYFPAGGLPGDVPLVVRPEQLLNFVAVASGKPEGNDTHLDESPTSSSPKLRSDREQNLLRVIAGLWALSGLPIEHNTTADKLSGLFDLWGWDKPAKPTIADTILKPAANLPGAKVRSSD